MAEKRVTLREVAEQAGVTRMTASLALRGKSRVSDATRRKVLKAAEKLGYEPDPEVAKLMAHIRKKQTVETKACLALLTSGRTADEWKCSVTEQKYVEGAKQRARAYGYRIETFWLNDPRMSGARLSNIIWNRGIEGVIIAPLQGRLTDVDSRSIDLRFDLFSAVEISETIDEPDLDRALHDQYTSMLKLLGRLSDLNYRTAGLVLEEALDLRVNHQWAAAYIYYRQQSAHKGMPPPLILPTAKQSTFDRWYDRYRPDAIISVAGFGLELASNRGLKIPQEVGYASLDVSGVEAVLPGVSGIDQQSELVGAAAVDMVVGAIQRGQRGIPDHPFRTQMEGTWVPGRTVVQRRFT